MQTINVNLLEKILYHVEKPGRYVGGEHNQILKDWDSIRTHVCLVFPDIYDIGQPNLGLAILYDILNQQPDILAERAFAPWHDLKHSFVKMKSRFSPSNQSIQLPNLTLLALVFPTNPSTPMP